MYGSWTEKVSIVEKCVGFIWDISNVLRGVQAETWESQALNDTIRHNVPVSRNWYKILCKNDTKIHLNSILYKSSRLKQII